MQPFLGARVIWQDEDLVEIELTAANTSFRGCTRVYTTYDALRELASDLRGFPQSLSSRVLHEAGDAAGYSYVHLEFYCFDDVGHTAARITVEANTLGSSRVETKDRVVLELQFEPAALDRFVAALDQLVASEDGEATLDGISPYTQNIATPDLTRRCS